MELAPDFDEFIECLTAHGVESLAVSAGRSLRCWNAAPCPPMKRSDVERWLSETDVETLGAAFALLIDRRVTVEPSLRVDEYDEFVSRFLGTCMTSPASPDGDWTLTPYIAGHAAASWISAIDPAVEKVRLVWWVEWLEGLYRSNGPDGRDVVVNGVLEHLFEHARLRRAFDGWRRDPVLAPAWDAASSWVANRPANS